MDYLRNHYIPKFLLKNFSEKAENGKWKINYINLGSRKVERRNLKAVFAQNNFYDIPSASDTKILEKRFNLKIETPMAQIVDKIISSNEGYITITRKELGIIKKFILIQMYRNPANQGQYQNASEKDSFTFSKAFKKESETDIDYWKREMLYVIEQ